MRSVFGANWGDGEVRVSEERQQKMDVRTFLTVLGRHRFVLSPRGNGLDAHRTWEALLVRLKTRVVHLACTSPASRLHLACTSPASPQVGTIPIVRSSSPYLPRTFPVPSLISPGGHDPDCALLRARRAIRGAASARGPRLDRCDSRVAPRIPRQLYRAPRVLSVCRDEISEMRSPR